MDLAFCPRAAKHVSFGRGGVRWEPLPRPSLGFAFSADVTFPFASSTAGLGLRFPAAVEPGGVWWWGTEGQRVCVPMCPQVLGKGTVFGVRISAWRVSGPSWVFFPVCGSSRPVCTTGQSCEEQLVRWRQEGAPRSVGGAGLGVGLGRVPHVGRRGDCERPLDRQPCDAWTPRSGSGHGGLPGDVIQGRPKRGTGAPSAAERPQGCIPLSRSTLFPASRRTGSQVAAMLKEDWIAVLTLPPALAFILWSSVSPPVRRRGRPLCRRGLQLVPLRVRAPVVSG